MDRRTFIGRGLAAVGSAVALAGCSAGGPRTPPPDASYDVGMSTAKFLPASVTVAPGETVVWKNTSSHTHTVTAYAEKIPDGSQYFASGGFESQAAAVTGWGNGEGGIEPQDTYEHTFKEPGEYGYFCIPHESSGMVGSVLVEDATTQQ